MAQVPALDGRFVRAPDALWRDLVDGVLLLSPSLEQPIAVLGPAADAWDALSAPAEFPDVVRQLVERYRGRPADVERDLAGVFAELERSSLIVRVP